VSPDDTPGIEKMQKPTRSILLLLGFTVVIHAGSVRSFGETLSGSYQFGPGTSQLTGAIKSLNVPARTNINVIVTLQRNLTNPMGIPHAADIAVKVDLIRPDGSTAISQDASASVIGVGLPIPVVPMPGVFNSQRGCPGTWRVRVRTASGAAPAVRIFGTVTFNYFPPGTVSLAMEAGTLNIDGGSTSNKTLSGHDVVSLNRNLIAGTGVFRIKAKWHTDPLDVFNFGRYFPLTVRLIRPDGTVAASETGAFSQHSPSGNSPKVNFSYTATAADANMSGTWKVRVASGSNNPRIVNLDIERGFDILSPSFNSTFSPQCGTATAIS
jgi:hypothetical protein